MRKFKIAYWVTIAVLLLLFFVQNQEFFMEKKKLIWNVISISALEKLGLKPFIAYETPEIQLILFFLIYFIAGVLLTLFYSFVVNFKVKRAINTLNRTIDTQSEKIEELESELSAFRHGTPMPQKEVIDISDDEEE